MRTLSTLLLITTFPAAVAAQAAPGMLVSTDWVAGRLDDERVIVLHAESAEERYASAHIPGARFLDMTRLVWDGEGGLGVEMRGAEEVEAALEAAGVTDEGQIVVYGGNPLIAARAWMTLDVMGLGDRISLLDGGLGAWREEGWELSGETPDVRPGSVTLAPRRDVLVDADWILARLDDRSVTLVDARPDDEYTGADGGMGGRANPGHIPGAYQMYWEELVESRALPRMHDRSTVEALFGASGAEDGGTVVAYCMVGLRASYTYFVARLLGYDAKFYDGSWHDWGTRDLPFVEGPARR